ncbi:hypothetical protein ABIA68_001290 [Stenotrophomonas rhizophila]|jgi:hypothetical protein|uniref:hypothetical protein n=1 Tax=Stenotrophomonas rhizophila TaxID=216778 RepID=UPI0033931722
MIRTFESLDEAAHHLYLEGLDGPLRCCVDSVLWDVWVDGRYVLVGEGAGK